jgi:vacuolar-type H+-ATPase subunit H
MVSKLKKFKSKKSSGLPLEVEQQILSMPPGDLAVEAAREQVAVDTLKTQLKEDVEIRNLRDSLKEFKEKEWDGDEDVQKAKEAYNNAKDAATSDEHRAARDDLKALEGSWKDDIKQRSKKLKYMRKTLKKHMESGALPSFLDKQAGKTQGQ